MNAVKASTEKCSERAEDLFLIAAFSDSNFEGKGKFGKMFRQERPACCGNVIDLFQAHVTFRDVTNSGKTFTVLEPYCPSCSRKVEAKYQILS
jgi:hypothetical protein